MTISITQLDQLVLTLVDVQIACRFMTPGNTDGHVALHLGEHHIMLQAKQPLEKLAKTTGSVNLRLVCSAPVEVLQASLVALGVLPEGQITKRQENGQTTHSLYLRDSSGQLIELINVQTLPAA